MDQTPSLETRLQAELERVVDWLKYEEAKNGVLITLNGAAAGLLAPWVGSKSVWLPYALWLCILLFLVSFLIGLWSFYPQTDPHKAHERAVQKLRLSRCKNDKKEVKPSLLFFKDIAGLDSEEYLTKFRSATRSSGGEEATQFQRDYAGQIIVNAELALLKIHDFRLAFRFTFTAVALACVAIFVSQLLEVLKIPW